MSKGILALVILTTTVPLAAKEQSRTFDEPPAVVFKAALYVANQQGVITHSDKDNLQLTFKSGGYWNKGFDIQVLIERDGSSGSRVLVKPEKEYWGLGWGAAKRINGKFFEGLEQELRQEHTAAPFPSSASPSAGKKIHVGENQAPQELSAVAIKSIPDGADIAIDGNFAGNTPATLQLRPGRHLVSIAKRGFKTWKHSITLTPSGKTHIDATLIKSP